MITRIRRTRSRISCDARVGAGALTRPAEQSSAIVARVGPFSEVTQTRRALLARPDGGVRAYVG